MTAEMPAHSAMTREIYDAQAAEYAQFQENSFPWKYIERPAFDRYLTSDYLSELTSLYRPDVRALDVGCGSGIVVRHLIERGLQPENIVGIDISSQLLSEARSRTPGAAFAQASADYLPFLSSSFDLVTSNMVFHYLDNEQLKRTLDAIFRVLKPGGTLFYIMPDPDYDEETRDPLNVNSWLERPTPWGGTAPWYSRDPSELLLHQAYRAGFEHKAGWPLPVSPEGQEYPELYERYTSCPSRIGVRLQRVSDTEKAERNL